MEAFRGILATDYYLHYLATLIYATRDMVKVVLDGFVSSSQISSINQLAQGGNFDGYTPIHVAALYSNAVVLEEFLFFETNQFEYSRRNFRSNSLPHRLCSRWNRMDQNVPPS